MKQLNLKLETENEFEKYNPTELDLKEALISLDLKLNTFLILSISEYVFCQVAIMDNNEFYIENHISDTISYNSKLNIDFEKTFEVLESVNQRNQKWKKVIEWDENLKSLKTEMKNSTKMFFVGLCLFIIILLISGYYNNFKGSGIFIFKFKIELVILFITSLWLMFPNMYKEINFKKNADTQDNFRSIIFVIFTISSTLLVIIEIIKQLI